MAGNSIGFPTQKVRDALHKAMILGSPINVGDRVTFRWSPNRRAGAGVPVDPSGVPYDLTQTGIDPSPHPDVQIPCAVRYVQGIQLDTPVGEFDPARAALTILDVDFAKITGADVVLIGETVWDVDYVAPPEALFDMGVYTVHITANTQGPHNATKA